MTNALSRRRSWAVALAGTAAMAISFFDRQTLAVLAPTVTAALHVSDAAYGWLGAAFSLAYLAGAPIAGWLVDRIGARRALLGAIVAWTIVAALHAFAPGFAALFALRLALGLAESPSFPASVQTVQRVLAPTDRARGMSTLFVGMSLGAMLVPPLAVGLSTRFGWRAAFAITACVGAAWVPLWLAVAFRRDARAVLDAPRDVPRGRVSWALLKHPAIARALVALVAVTPCSAFAAAWEAKLYVRQFALAQRDLGGYLMASAFAYDVGALLFGDLAARRARARDDGSAPRLLFGLGGLLACVGMVTLAFAPSPGVAVVAMIVGGAGRGALVTLLNSDMAARAPREHVSTAAGVIASVQAGAHFVVNPVVGYAVQSSGYRGVLLALAAWVVPGVAAWIAWRDDAAAPARSAEA